MATHIHGKHFEVTPALQAYAEQKIGSAQSWFDETVTIHVTLLLQARKQEHVVEATIPYHGMVFRVEVKDADMYAAIDQAADKLDRKLRKYKERTRRKLRSHGRSVGTGIQDGGQPEPEAPEEAFVIAKEKRLVMKPVDLQEAVLQMNLLDHSFHLFLNRDTNREEVVYRRADGTYGHLFAD